MNTSKELNGIYLVIDPGLEIKKLFPRLMEALEAGVDILQIWNNWKGIADHEEREDLIETILNLAWPFNVPVLINDEWEYLRTTSLHGVHFDKLPDNLEEIRKEVGRDIITGLTCGNDPDLIIKANENEMDYISFCSMLPSGSVDTCEIVHPGSVLEARKITDIPIFLSGGLRPENLYQFNKLDFQGIAVISGIMDAPSITETVKNYKKALDKIIS